MPNKVELKQELLQQVISLEDFFVNYLGEEETVFSKEWTDDEQNDLSRIGAIIEILQRECHILSDRR